MIQSVLIANRGEIACRIIATLRRMRITSIAVYHFDDRRAPHVELADAAVELTAEIPSAAYLDVPQLLAAATQSGAQAIHPGYGFLAENSGFARAVTDAGLIFVGPSAEVIEIMGDKIRATDFAISAGIPVAPRIINDDIASLLDEVDTLGYPVLIKAAAGGGGKGMKIADNREQLRERIAVARSEAQRYFLDGRVYVEHLIERPRHIEVQIFGDGKGNAIHLFERECSIQRRFQKIIEESPAPNLYPAVRDQICAAAVKLASAAKYLNAGTVEFILDQDNAFYFLEMNTRLQVEHPVTEQVTGFDLVEEQIHIADSGLLRLKQADVVQRGHAIECRICAEQPDDDFRPATGTVRLLRLPEGDEIRIDNGVSEGQEIGAAFDSMLAKLIVHSPTREQAIATCISALRDYVLLGVAVNIEFLGRIVRHPVFQAGQLHTGFIPEHIDELRAAPLEQCDLDAVLLAAALATDSFKRDVYEIPDLHAAIGHWRN
jgi:propionyl-CoA carboxylase alpha chain/3-methylcrotonyl-CoA carboxylase alpha subunit/acetyl-CoA/propionyl-CoA carboxylase biotin carboxyl carrier protein